MSTNGTHPKTVKAVAIQPMLKVGEVDANLRRCEDLVRVAAREHEPNLILLPEAFTSPNVYQPACRAVPVPIDGKPYQMLRRLARELGCAVGGGYLSVRGADARHTFVMAQPDGSTWLHDKDEPSAWEYCYYVGGKDDGVWSSTMFGPVGCAMGWETARSRTAHRLRDAGVQLVVGGGCWPGFPHWVAPKWLLNRDYGYYKLWAKDTTANLARAVGAPTVLAWHVGPVHSRTPLMPGVVWNTEMIGETQICEADGRVLGRLGPDDGEGFIAAEVTLAAQPTDPIPDGFWLRPQTASIHAVWHYMKQHGKARYRYDKSRHRFPWQDLPDHDIPNHNPASPLTEDIDVRQTRV